MGSWPQQLLILVAAFKGSFKVEDIDGEFTEAVAVRATALLALTVVAVVSRARDVTIAVASSHWVPLTASFKAFVFTLDLRG